MAEAWIYEKHGDIGVVMDENGLPVCMRVSEEDGERIASAPRLAEQVRILREALSQISLCSQNSASSKEECGRIARFALGRGKYDLKRIAWEINETAAGRAYYGNALRVAKDLLEITTEDREVLDAWETGAYAHNPKRNWGLALQEIASKVRSLEATKEAPC